MIESEDHIDQVWPGFHPVRTAFVLLGDTVAIAATQDPLDPPFRTVGHCNRWVIASAPQHELKRQGLWLVDVGGGRSLPAAPRRSVFGDDWPFQLVAELVHERFHSYQDSTFGATPVGSALTSPELVTTETVSPEFQALWAAERVLLLDAMEDAAIDPNTALCRIAAIRARRASRALPATQAVAHEERKEGTAYWVGNRAAPIALNSKPSLRLLLRNDLYHVQQKGAYLDRDAFRLSLYATGAGIAVLLDSANQAWRDQVQQGATFDDVLSRAVPAHCLGAEEAASALKDADYASLLRQAEQTASSITNPFADSTAPRLIITGVRALSTRTSGKEMKLSQTESIFESPGLIEFTTADGVVRIEGHPVRLQRLPRGLTVTVLLDARTLETLAAQSSAIPLRISRPGLTIGHTSGAVITRTGDAVLLELTPRK